MKATIYCKGHKPLANEASKGKLVCTGKEVSVYEYANAKAVIGNDSNRIYALIYDWDNSICGKIKDLPWSMVNQVIADTLKDVEVVGNCKIRAGGGKYSGDGKPSSDETVNLDSRKDDKGGLKIAVAGIIFAILVVILSSILLIRRV